MQRMQQMIAVDERAARAFLRNSLTAGRSTRSISDGHRTDFGPEVAPRILIDERNLFHVDPEDENLMMHNGMPAEVHPRMMNQTHLRTHITARQMTGDPRSVCSARTIQRTNKTMHRRCQTG